ncbi:MAG: ABC transporter permease, partial [Roseiarcus sp.]
MAEPRPADRRHSVRLWLGAAWIGLLLVCAAFAGVLSPHDRLAQDLMLQTLPPAWIAGAEPGYYLGTDSLGRDILARIIFATRPALAVATVASTAACLFGASLGIAAG